MSLPCRTRRSRNCIRALYFAWLFAAGLLTPTDEIIAQYGAASTSQAGNAATAGTGGGSHVPLEITSGVDFGYDDHVLGSNATTSSAGQDSFFTRENIVLTYDRPAEATEVSLIAVGRFTQFLDAGTDDKDGNVTAAFTHRFSTRLSFRADLHAAYQTEPNFQSNIGPENVRAPHFDTHDIFSLAYNWLPRLSSVTSYTFERIKYEQSTPTIGLAQDRSQHTFAEGLHFSLTRRTNLILEYRYLIVDYDTAPRDSTTHFALAGFDHHLTEHLLFNVLGGESFRSFKGDGDSVDPYAEVKINYQGGNHSLSWRTTYGVEEATESFAMGSTTFRTGVNATYDLTSRTTARAGVFYHHSDNQGSSGTTSGGAQDALQLTLGLKYTINKHFAAHVDYEYTEQSASAGVSGYSRNRVFAGMTYTY
jgi:hypothetical protein